MAKLKTKESKVTSFSLDVKVLDRMDNYSRKTFVPKTKIIEQAVTEYLNKMEESNPLSNKEEKDG